MTRADLLHVLDALQDADAEFEELMLEKEWYVTAVTDKLASAKQIIEEALLSVSK